MTSSAAWSFFARSRRWCPYLSAMAAEHPVWAEYLARWEEMSKVLEEELPSGKAPRLFRIMEQIRAKVRAEELDQEKARK